MVYALNALQSYKTSRNPLKSGQCFLLIGRNEDILLLQIGSGRNPLKSGQCFLLLPSGKVVLPERGSVAIPSNRVNVSYFEKRQGGGD